MARSMFQSMFIYSTNLHSADQILLEDVGMTYFVCVARNCVLLEATKKRVNGGDRRLHRSRSDRPSRCRTPPLRYPLRGTNSIFALGSVEVLHRSILDTGSRRLEQKKCMPRRSLEIEHAIRHVQEQ